MTRRHGWLVTGPLALLMLASAALRCSSDDDHPGPVPRAPLRVAADGSGDYADIAAALAAARDGDTILLADGTYQGPGNVDLDPAGKAVVIASESLDPARCIIACQGSAAEPHRGFYIHSGEGQDCRIEGLTVTGGYAEGPTGSLDRAGGAVHCRESSSPVFVNCTFTACHAGYCGGAVVIAHESNPLFTDCSFGRNTSTWGGALCTLANAQPRCEGCRFDSNSVSNAGGALYAAESGPTFAGCTFAGNSAPRGGAIACAQSAAPTVSGCTFTGNQGSYTGGAFYCEQSALRIEQCTLVGNASGRGAGLHCQVNSDIVLRRTILAFSPAGEAVTCLDWSCLLDVQCCDVYGNAGGDWTTCLEGALATAGNIARDPLFVDRENGDFHLAAGSPCGPDSAACGTMGAWEAAADVGPASGPVRN